LRPDATDWADGLLTCQLRLGFGLRSQGRPDDARARLELARRIADRLAAAHPDEAVGGSWQGPAPRGSGGTPGGVGDVRAAMMSSQEALALATAAAARDPTDRRIAMELGLAYEDFADAQSIAGDPRSAIAAARASRDIAATLARADATNRALAADLGEREIMLCKAQRVHHELG